MLLGQEINHHEADQMINYYKGYFDYVGVVYCNKCDAPIGVLVGEPKTPDTLGLRFNDAGYAVISINDRLFSSRARLDKTSDGRPMLGFHCANSYPNPNYDTELKAWQDKIKKTRAKNKGIIDEYIKGHEGRLADAREKYFKKGGKTDEFGRIPIGTFDDIVYEPPQFDPEPLFTAQETIACGNNTILASIEEGLIPVGSQPLDYSNPFEKHSISEKIKNDPNYKADFSDHAGIRRYETFRVEKQ